MTLGLDDLLEQIRQLAATLRPIAQKDQEQEVRGMAIPVIDAVLTEGRSALPDGDPILNAISDVISAENIEAGEPVRAFDVLVVVEQLEARLSKIQRDRMGHLSFSPEPGPFDRDF